MDERGQLVCRARSPMRAVNQKGVARWGGRAGVGLRSWTGSRMRSGRGAKRKRESRECDEEVGTVSREGADPGEGRGHRVCSVTQAGAAPPSLSFYIGTTQIKHLP